MTDDAPLAVEPNPDDVASIDAIVAALYDTISGPAGDRDWSRLRSLFLADGRLIPTGERPNGQNGLDVLSVDAFIAQAGAYMAENAFYEREIARRTDRFGDIAHALSTYESRTSEDGEPFMRGINSIQLVRKDGRWWVVTIFWQNESDAHPIPAKYLAGDA